MALPTDSTTARPEVDADGPAVSTRTRILDVGERLVQVRGFNGFSYADVAAELSVAKASLHYHFPSKAELGEAIVTRYARGGSPMHCCNEIDAQLTHRSRKARGVREPHACQVLREERMLPVRHARRGIRDHSKPDFEARSLGSWTTTRRGYRWCSHKVAAMQLAIRN